MNKTEVRALILKEIKASNLSELAKGLLEEMLDSDSCSTDKEVSAIRTPKRESTTIIIPQPLASRLAPKPAPTPRELYTQPGQTGMTQFIPKPRPKGGRLSRAEHAQRQELFHQIRAYIVDFLSRNSAARLNIPQVGRKHGIKDTFYLLQFLKKCSHGDYKLVQAGAHQPYYAVSKLVEPATAGRLSDADAAMLIAGHSEKREHKDYPFDKGEPTKKPMSRMQFYKKFMSEATKKHMAEGHEYIKASMMARQEYSAYCAKRDGRGNETPAEKVEQIAAIVEFPEIKWLPDTSVPYLKDMLKKMDAGKIQFLSEPMDGYVLGIVTGEWANFLADLMTKDEQIKAAMGLSKGKDFVVRNRILYFE
jgi:hypothetical protein